MSGLLEFVQLCIALPVLPFTVLLIAVIGYWMFFIIGAVTLDTFDFDIDGDVEPGFDADVDVEFDADTGVPTTGSGAFVSFLRFFNVGDVPLMVLVSVLVFNLWAISLLTNHFFNAELSLVAALLWLVPNVIMSLILMKIFTLPLRRLFKELKSGIDAPVKIVGQTCIITTSKVTPTFGQASMAQDGAPITLNVRTKEGEQLSKGDEALVVARNEDNDTYVVVPFDLEMKNV